MTPEALEALIYDRIVDLAEVDELDNEQIHAIAHEAASAVDPKVITKMWLEENGPSAPKLETLGRLCRYLSGLDVDQLSKDANRWAQSVREVSL